MTIAQVCSEPKPFRSPRYIQTMRVIKLILQRLLHPIGINTLCNIVFLHDISRHIISLGKIVQTRQ